MQAVILAGGKGTRLAERLQGRPKPLVDVAGVPLLERQIVTLRTYGVDDVVILVNHAADQIEAFCRERKNFGLARLTLIDDGVPRGTAGAVLACLDRLADRFLVVYGDTLFNIDIDRFLTAHAEAGADATLFLHPNDHPSDSDLVAVQDGRVTAFLPKPHPPGALRPNLVNAAFYVIERRLLDGWRSFPTPADFGQDLFPALLERGAFLQGFNSFEYIKDLGTPKRLDTVYAHLRSGVVARASLRTPQACVFVDRDGTLNALRDYVRRPEDLVLLPGAVEAVRRFNEAEQRIAVVTNQPVIARGECSPEGLRAIHAKLDMALGEAGAFIDRLYVCPHHPDAGFPGEVRALKVACACRKPQPGLILQAARDLNADLARSWMIGDSTSDLGAARNAGVRSILVLTGEGGRDGKYRVRPDFTVPDIAAAATFILDIHPRLVAETAALVDGARPGDIICIGGPARSGKSTVAAVLAHELRRAGHDARVLPLDSWIRPEAERTEAVLGRFDVAAATAALEPWLEGGATEIDLPYYDRRRRLRCPGESVGLRADTVVILEGVPALMLPLETDRRVLTIHLGTGEAGRQARVIADLMDRGLADRDEAAAVYAARQRDEIPLVERAGRGAGLRLILDPCFS
ncbi:HAD-IIIA family hydrolase [Methylobacterium brachiatum]|uniref:HAD-IIIA family hydrolase n=1 Tax=Methylobacterium brachiatum TaxID=269660 RepID=UPI0008ED8A25|nr:HAD-IIIA family hydrolase [Methylobacterium brachiatum]SFJ05371.1 D,D-heptose 1,7-bisphosphate phosphatase [Methylobacterium brachiatum]